MFQVFFAWAFSLVRLCFEDLCKTRAGKVGAEGKQKEKSGLLFKESNWGVVRQKKGKKYTSLSGGGPKSNGYFSVCFFPL